MRHTLALLTTIASLALGARAQEAAPAAIPELDARLAALEPSDPRAYFELGEEVAQEAANPAEVDLARRLFALTYELADSQSPLRASACLALASLAGSERDRTALRALASSLRGWPIELGGAGSAVASEEVSFRLATALGHYRAGEYSRAAPLLANPDVRELLRQYGHMIGSDEAILRDIRSQPNCRECRNRRIIVADLDPKRTHRLCYTCGGNPGPDLTDLQLLAHLRLESILLSDVERSWSAQLLEDAGAPLRDLDPDNLASSLGVDPSRTIYRDGAWTSPAGNESNDEAQVRRPPAATR